MALIKRCLIKSGSIVIFCAAAMTIFLCNDYNPFTDPINAKVYVTSWTFTDRDSVALYETGTFEVVVAVREEVDSITFSASKNRYWTDTVIKGRSTERIPKGGPYLFHVSFFDTGLQTSTLTTFRSNGEILSQDFPVRVYNPLWQDDVSGYFGNTLELRTMPVPDEKKGVLYHWNLGGNWNGTSVSNLYSAPIYQFAPRHGNGSLWVSDLSGKNGSPAVVFSYAFNDTSKPFIKCMNEGMVGDTIFSGDTVFAFRVLISDAGSAEVESCSVNREPFDFINRSTGIYTKVFDSLPALTTNGKRLPLTVFALDNQQFRNSASHTYFVDFSTSGTKSDRVSVTFDRPGLPMVTTSQRSYLIHGSAQNNGGDTMKLSCRINAKDDPVVKTIVGSGEWNWQLYLDTTVHDITVAAYSVDGRLWASAQCVIVFDPNALDSIKPMIYEVSTGGQFLGSQFYTDKSSLPLRIVAFDDGSGMARLVVNKDTLLADPTSYVWMSNTGDLLHGPDGNSVHIVAIDKRNNKQERTIVFYKNSPPALVGSLGIPGECCAESTYNVRCPWWDPDGDAMDLKKIKVPVNMTVAKEEREVVFSWHPVWRTGTDKDTLILDLSDSYESNRLQWIFSLKRCRQDSLSITFATTDRDFPKVLQAGYDRLNVRLSINSTDVIVPHHYGAWLLDNGNALLDNDTSGMLLWAPSLADTGYRKLMVTVGDDNRGFDTLFPAVWVVPKNQNRCSLSVVFSGTSTATGALDLFSHPAPETLFFAIRDEDHPLTESYTATVTLGSLRSVEVLDQKDFFVAIEPDSSRLDDTLNVMVRDMTGSSDSMQFVIQYATPDSNIPPRLSEDPGFPIYFCADSSYSFKITASDLNGDSVEVVTLHRPEGMSVSSQGDVLWTPSLNALGDDSLVIMLNDGLASTYVDPWVLTALDCDNMPPPVSFKTSDNDFPTQLQAEVDSVALQLETEEGTGVPPFTFQARMDNGAMIINNSSTGLLYWVPTGVDSGVRTMTLSVTDRYNTADTISPQITVIPRNHHLCSLSYIYSGDTLPSGQLYLHSTTEPESALFVISDADDPRLERYVVTINRPRQAPTTQRLAGAERSFSVKISHPYYASPTTDTIIVSVNDSTGSTDTVLLVARYPISDPDSIADCTFALSASEGVTSSYMGNRVSEWIDEAVRSGPPWTWVNDSGITLSQSDADRQPILVQNKVNLQPAILFDDVTDNGDDGLFSTTMQWANAPFTVFVVFSARSMVAIDRTALVTTNTIYGFGLGFACDGTIGILNDVTRKCCGSTDCQGTDLHVSPNTWYVAVYQSELGITVGGNVRVQTWLNGTAASLAMEMTTQSNAGVAVGTGSAATYNGSFDGWIASIVLYKRALSPDERSLVERYLGGLYNITIK